MLKSFVAAVNREPIEAMRREEIRFCRYRLDALLQAPEQNQTLIDTVQKRLQCSKCPTIRTQGPEH